MKPQSSKRVHAEERIAEVKQEFLFDKNSRLKVVPSANNKVCLFVIDHGSNYLRRVISNNLPVAETDGHLPFALSFDDQKLAVAIQRHNSETGRVSNEIQINGTTTHAVNFDTVYHLVWLTNNRLAWSCWNTNEEDRVDSEGIRYFVNGEDVTDKLVFEPIFLGVDGNGRAVVVQEDDHRYLIHDDGRTEYFSPVDLSDGRYRLTENMFPKIHMEVNPEFLFNERSRKATVKFGKVIGPEFDDIESLGIVESNRFVFNCDFSNLAYVGTNFSGWAHWVTSLSEKLIKRAEAKEDYEDGKHRNKIPWWLWPAIIAVSPYSAMSRRIEEAARHCFPVRNHRPWKHSFKDVSHLFFTPSDKLAAVVRSRSGWHVAIDDEIGPTFQEIFNARWLPNENAICYLGRRGANLLRVLVSS